MGKTRDIETSGLSTCGLFVSPVAMKIPREGWSAWYLYTILRTYITQPCKTPRLFNLSVVKSFAT